MGIFDNWFTKPKVTTIPILEPIEILKEEPILPLNIIEDVNDEQLGYILRITYIDGSKEDKNHITSMNMLHTSLNRGYFIVDSEIINMAAIRKILLIKNSL